MALALHFVRFQSRLGWLLEKNPNYPQKQQLQEYIEKAKQHAKG
jgi:hypothetical protein